MELITRSRLPLALSAALLVAALVAVGPASAAPKTANGAVGPGFTISLKLGGKKVTRLKPTTYKFRVTDKSSMHNFRLKGPGYNKAITSVGFTGTKTVTVKLTRGKWEFYCAPHRSVMHGQFSVR